MPRPIRLSFLFALSSFLYLTGCASVPDRPPVADPAAVWAARQQELGPVGAWQLTGRVALHTAQEGWQATLVWARDRDQHRIDLTGPLGRGHLRLTQDEHGAQLRDADQRVYRAGSSEELLLRVTGWQLPLDGLNYWVLGLPAPRAPAESGLDPWGRLKTLRQLGWDIEFLEYTHHGTAELPSRLFMKRREVPQVASRDNVAVENGSLEARLVIDRWVMK